MKTNWIDYLLSHDIFKKTVPSEPMTTNLYPLPSIILEVEKPGKVLTIVSFIFLTSTMETSQWVSTIMVVLFLGGVVMTGTSLIIKQHLNIKRRVSVGREKLSTWFF